MSKVLIDNDEEGDDGIGIHDVEAVNRLHLAVDATVNDTIDELARLRAVNQELVTALRSVVTMWRAMVANAYLTGPIPHDEVGHAARWTAVDMCADELDRALQHAETRTP